MTFIQRLTALWQRSTRSAIPPMGVPAAMTPPVRTPLATWSDEDLRTLLATAPAGSRVGYFAYHPGQRTIDDLAGSYVTVIVEADGTFRRTAGNHGRSDAPRTCTPEAVMAEIVTGRGSADAFVDRTAA